MTTNALPTIGVTPWRRIAHLAYGMRASILRCVLAVLAGMPLVLEKAPGAPADAPAAPAAAAINPNRMQAVYPIAYGPVSAAEIKAVLDRIVQYLEKASPIRVINLDTNETVADLSHLPEHVGLAHSDFTLTGYEWGVTYSGMLRAADATGDTRFRDYTANHLRTIAVLAEHLKGQPLPQGQPQIQRGGPGEQRMFLLRPVIDPRALDDCGAMCAAMIKASRAGISPEELRPCIDRYMAWIVSGQFRFADGTLARNRPLPRTLWLDDLYMSVPALAQMGAATGEKKYYDDAARQILQFSARMFVPEDGLYRHGWVEAMDPHPVFHWGRANGWAVVSMAELLDVLPADHPDRPAILAQFKAHVAGLAKVQDHTGLWHQLLDRPDTYLETSASAMYVYGIALGINRGWLDAAAYSPMVTLGWNAVAAQVNAQGQVENTCVGTGMGFDPMFYAYRPVSVYAAHGYGPVLLAGAEMIRLRAGAGHATSVNGGAVQVAPGPQGRM
jgi:rhamnogalacturonyl hydrolase YesR